MVESQDETEARLQVPELFKAQQQVRRELW